MFWAEQHVQWREQDRNALNSQHSGFVRAAQEYGQARRDEVRVAVAQATEMSSAEMLARMYAVKHREEQNLIFSSSHVSG